MYEKILINMNIPNYVSHIIEPFAGQGDLLKFPEFLKRKDIKIECYDIEPKKDYIIKRDTLLNPPVYKNKFIITNPPFLARNKSKNKEIFEKYKQNDLFKCLIAELINNNCEGGILILPLNFWSSIRKADHKLRKDFLEIYNVLILNVFEEKVFDDTSYSICSFQFELKRKDANTQTKCFIHPSGKVLNLELNANTNTFDLQNNCIIGGEIYNLPQNSNIIIERLTTKNKDSIYKTNILAKCIDDNINSQIGLSYQKDKIYIDETPKLSARSYATLVINMDNKPIFEELQKKLIIEFNNYIKTSRIKYNSLFLTNYRESNSIARKRISFTLLYKITNFLLGEMSKKI